MFRIKTALTHLAQESSDVRAVLAPMLRQADKWKKLPNGWTQDSVDKFWSSLTGENKHKVTECIKKMDGKVTDPGAFCASLADKVMGPEWRSKKAALNAVPVSTSVLPKSVLNALAEVRFNKRKVSVGTANTFSMYSAGDDGAKGFTALVDIDTNQSSVTWGEWGGGALGKRPGPVDDVNTPKKSLPDHLVVIQGQVGGRAPYATITCTPATFPRLTGASRMAHRKTAALIEHLGPYSKIVDVVVRAIKEHMQEDRWSKDPKPLATGFIYSLFQALNDRRIEQALFNLFERRGPSLDARWAWQLAGSVKSRLGSGAHAKVIAGAIGMALLAKTKQPRLAAMYEELLNGLLARELEDVGAPSGGKAMNPSQTFEAAIDNYIQELVRDALGDIGKNPAAAENLVWLVAEDVNWHSVESVGSNDTPVDQELVSSIVQRLDWNLDSVAVFGVALLRAVGLKQKAEALKREALREFADSFEDLGPTREASSQENKMNSKQGRQSLNRVAHRWMAHLRGASVRRTAMDEVRALSDLFQGVMPYVKDWRRFLNAVRDDLGNMRLWERLLLDVDVDSDTTDTGSINYDEIDVTYAAEIHMKMTMQLGLKLLPKVFLQQYHGLVKDPAGFSQALSDLAVNHNAVVMLGKLIAHNLSESLAADPGPTLEDIQWSPRFNARSFIEDTAKDAVIPSYAKVDYLMTGATMSPPTVKAAPTGVAMIFEGHLALDYFDIEFEREYD